MSDPFEALARIGKPVSIAGIEPITSEADYIKRVSPVDGVQPPTWAEVTAMVAKIDAEQRVALVRAECQRRITALVGAPGQLESALIRQLNALMRAVELTNNKHTRFLTDAERAEEAALAALADKIKALRACSNVLEANPPADYTADKYWVIP